MSSDEQLHLPKIDFSGLHLSAAGGDKWAAVQTAVVSAVETYSCFEAVYDKVTPELEDALFSKAAKELFGLPSERKEMNVSNKTYHGYMGNIPGRAYESLNIENAADCNGVEEFSAVMWGVGGNPSFCDTVHAFSKHLSELEQMIRRMLLESLGVSKYFNKQVESTAYDLRLSEYGGGGGGGHRQADKVGLQRHTDVMALSIVCQHGVEGLEVEAKDGRWLKPSPNSMTLLIGQAFWAWSNGRIKPSWHRVLITNKSEARYSVIFGAYPRDGYMVEAPEELVDGEHPLLFRPYKYEDYLRFIASQKLVTSQKCALPTYCGVPRDMDAYM